VGVGVTPKWEGLCGDRACVRSHMAMETKIGECVLGYSA